MLPFELLFVNEVLPLQSQPWAHGIKNVKPRDLYSQASGRLRNIFKVCKYEHHLMFTNPFPRAPPLPPPSFLYQSERV